VDNIQIEKWIKEAHGNAVEHGFYNCPKCDGVLTDDQKTEKVCEYCYNEFQLAEHCEDCDKGSKDYDFYYSCKNCNNTRIDPHKNIGELLMLIVCEIAEAVEAHRSGRFGNWKAYKSILNELDDNRNNSMPPEEKQRKQNEAFHLCIKDSHPDEIADVFIRLFDLCGYLEYCPIEFKEVDFKISDNIPSALFEVTHLLNTFLHFRKPKCNMEIIFNYLYSFCIKNNIPIEKHITAKMAYNRTREYKHGKEY